MGLELLAAIAADPERWQLAGLWVRPDLLSTAAELPGMPGAASAVVVSSDLSAVIETADVAIDFTLPSATGNVLSCALDSNKPLVSGVSGLDTAQLEALRRASASIPLFYSRNMSIGIALLRRAVEEAGSVLGAEAEALISDLHHAAKIDAPSGTALLLGEALAAARGQDFGEVMRYDAAAGRGTRRHSGDILFEVRREGSHPGRHTVRLAARGETLMFTHDVRNRGVFATGALRAAGWLAGRPSGLYGMQDLLRPAGE